MRRVGVVRWFSADRGFGFVVEEGTDKDIFMHYSSIQVQGYKLLEEGQRIAFTLINGEHGEAAADVVPLEAH